MEERAIATLPFSLLELTAKRAVVSVLDKPQWWRKWQDAAIRTKWLAEVRDGFVRQTFDQSAKWNVHEFETIETLRELVAQPDSDEKRAKVSEWLRFVRFEIEYQPGVIYPREQPGVPGEFGSLLEMSELWDDSEHCDDSEFCDEYGDYDEYDDYDVAFPDNLNHMNAYVYVQWYFTVARMQAALAALSIDQLTTEIVEPLLTCVEARSDPVVRDQCSAFIASLLSARELTNDDVRAALALTANVSELRDKALSLLLLRCKLIVTELQQLERYVVDTIDTYALQVFHLPTPTTTDASASVSVSPTGVYATWRSDDAVPQDVHAAFVAQIAQLEAVPDDAKDWHPHTNKQVLNLVHPSLYCLVNRRSPRVLELPDDATGRNPSDRMAKIAFAPTAPVQQKSVAYVWHGRNDPFQWLPADVDVASDGSSSHFVSYINNLHPTHFAPLYNSLEAILTQFVPLFERALTSVQHESVAPTCIVPDCYKVNYLRPSFPDATLVAPDVKTANATVTLRGKTLQVIVKIAEILLTPTAPTYDGGSWHIEGTEAEAIVATGIYYFASDNINDSRLSFRVQVKAPDAEQNDDNGMAIMYGLARDELLAQTLGSITTTVDGRCVVFPNGLQHKVEPFQLADATKPGVRKILAFFLVDPDTTITSTSVVPPQQQSWIHELAQAAVANVPLPLDAARHQVCAMLGGSGDGSDAGTTAMSLDEARAHRLRLMEYRSVSTSMDPEREGSVFNLCEH